MVPPRWRRDLTREIDLVEEVARIYGYDQIPEDVGVPMAPSHRTDEDRVLERVRQVLDCGRLRRSDDDQRRADDRGPTRSAPGATPQPLTASTPMLKGADTLRKSLIPSLLEARRVNESLANAVIELFESARVYLPQAERSARANNGRWRVTSGGDFHALKGVVETLLEILHVTASLAVAGPRCRCWSPSVKGDWSWTASCWATWAKSSAAGLKQFGLRSPTTVLELDLGVLGEVAKLIPQQQSLSDFPAIDRDLNLIVDESVRWADLAATIRTTVGPLLETLQFQEVYRDQKKDGADKKRLLFSITLRSPERTLTNEEADVSARRCRARVRRQTSGRAARLNHSG